MKKLLFAFITIPFLLFFQNCDRCYPYLPIQYKYQIQNKSGHSIRIIPHHSYLKERFTFSLQAGESAYELYEAGRVSPCEKKLPECGKYFVFSDFPDSVTIIYDDTLAIVHYPKDTTRLKHNITHVEQWQCVPTGTKSLDYTYTFTEEDFQEADSLNNG